MDLTHTSGAVAFDGSNEIDDPDRFGEQLIGDRPDPMDSVTEEHLPFGVGTAGSPGKRFGGSGTSQGRLHLSPNTRNRSHSRTLPSLEVPNS